MLNSENLNTILAQYIHDFAELSLSQTSGEGSLWQAIDTFGAEWDIEVSDFPAMFARAMQGAADQLDTPAGLKAADDARQRGRAGAGGLPLAV